MQKAILILDCAFQKEYKSLRDLFSIPERPV